MKTTYTVNTSKFFTLASRLFLATALLTLNLRSLHAQNLVVNSDFAGGLSSGWGTLSSIEIYTQTTYGGPSSSIYVTEIDVERTLNQQVCILPGLSYTFTYQASRRPQTGTPSNPGIQVKVTGVSSNTDYVNSIQAYTNTSWSAQTQTFTVAIPSNSTDKKVNIQFASNNNTSTYGVLVWGIQLSPVSTASLSINGPATSGVSTLNNFSLSNSPAGVSYNWSFSSDANYTSSVSAAPTGISWASIGAKNISVAVSNGICTMASYTKAVTISTTLPVEWASFTGAMEGNDARLTWVSGSEINGKYFMVNRSTDGAHFDSIGVITSIDASTAHTYQYVDKTMPTGNVYYRICHVDLDNAVSYSKIISLNNSGANRNSVRVFPNPATSTLNYNITSEQPNRVDIQIFSPSGVLMMTSQAQLSAGANQRSISIANLGHGSYFLKIVNAQGELQSMQTFLKM